MSKRKRTDVDGPPAKRARFVEMHSCYLCPYESDNKYNLKRHLASHSNARRHKCGRCDKYFKTKHQAHDHAQTVHIKAKTYACAHCPKTYTIRNSWKYHMVHTHSEEQVDAAPEELPDAAPGK